MTRLIAILIAIALIYFATMPWRAERYVEKLRAGEIPLEAARDWWLAFEPSLVAGQLNLRSPDGDLNRGRAHLENAIKLRPLYAPSYLTLAELEYEAGDRDRARVLADRSLELWPTRSLHLWRLGTFYARLGCLECAQVALSRYMFAIPSDARKVLSLLQRLGTPADRLVALIDDSMLDDPEARARVVRAALQYARRTNQPELVGPLWALAPESMRSDERTIRDYIATLFSVGQPEKACEVWKAVTGRMACLESLLAGDFEGEVELLGLGWRFQPRAGADIEVAQTKSGRALKVTFDGTENVNFNGVSQRVPVNGGGLLAVRGRWRGEAISTRSGVYVDAYLDCESGQRTIELTEPGYGSWDWVEFGETLDVPEDCSSLTLRIRRRATNNLDRLISGTVWFDDFSMERISTL